MSDKTKKPKLKTSKGKGIGKISNDDIYMGENSPNAQPEQYVAPGQAPATALSAPMAGASPWAQYQLDRIPTPKLNLGGMSSPTNNNQGGQNPSQAGTTGNNSTGGIKVYGGSFHEAFAKARAEMGGEGTFTWSQNGKTYHTGYAGERTKLNPSGASQRTPDQQPSPVEQQGAKKTASQIMGNNLSYRNGAINGGAAGDNQAENNSQSQGNFYAGMKNAMRSGAVPGGNILTNVLENADTYGNTGAAAIMAGSGGAGLLPAGVTWTAGQIIKETDDALSGNEKRKLWEPLADAAGTYMTGRYLGSRFSKIGSKPLKASPGKPSAAEPRLLNPSRKAAAAQKMEGGASLSKGGKVFYQSPQKAAQLPAGAAKRLNAPSSSSGKTYEMPAKNPRPKAKPRLKKQKA